MYDTYWIQIKWYLSQIQKYLMHHTVPFSILCVCITEICTAVLLHNQAPNCSIIFNTGVYPTYTMECTEVCNYVYETQWIQIRWYLSQINTYLCIKLYTLIRRICMHKRVALDLSIILVLQSGPKLFDYI